MASIAHLSTGDTITPLTNAAANLSHTLVSLNGSGVYAAANIQQYPVFFLSHQNVAANEFDMGNPVHRFKVQNYVRNGGMLVVFLDDETNNELFMSEMIGCASFAITNEVDGADIIVSTAHPLVTTPNALASTAFGASAGVSMNASESLGSAPAWQGGLPIAANTATARAIVSLFSVGNGRVLVIGEQDMSDFTNGASAVCEDFMENILTFMLADADTTPGQDGADETGFYCAPRGSEVETADPDAPFGPAVCLDYDAGKAYRWDHLPFTCGLFVASGCAAPAEIPDTNYFGGRGGWVYAFGQEAVYSDGLWEGETARFTVTAGDANSVTVASGFSTYGDGLKGVVASLVKNEGTSSESLQERTILFSSSTKAIICDPLTGEGSAWTSNPAAGDILYLGLITAYVEFPEIQTKRESYLGSIRPFIINDSGQTAYFRLETWGATSRNKWADATGAADGTRYFDDTEVNAEPEGIRPTPVDGGKAHRHRLTMRQPPGGEMVIVPGGQFADDGAIEADLIT